MSPYRPVAATSNTFTDGFHGLDARSPVVDAGLITTREALITTDGREATVARLQELAAAETQSLTGVLGAPEQVRMHSVGVNLRDLFDMA